MHGESHLFRIVLIGFQDALLSETGKPRLALSPCILTLLVHRLGEQPQPVAQLDVVTAQITARGWQVVGGHRAHGMFPPLLRLLGTTVRAGLEPHDRRPQDPPGSEVVPHPRFDRAQVLTDDQCTGAVRLQGHDAHHGLMVVPHVGAVPWAQPPGHPPQTKQPHDVVDTDSAGVTQGTRDHLTQWRVGHLLQHVRTHWRLPPVLAGLVERIRWGSDVHLTGEQSVEHPCVGTRSVDPDGKVTDEPDRHAGIRAGRLGRRELLVGDPLQPHVKVDPVGMFAAHPSHGSPMGIVQLGRPVVPVGTMQLGEQAPCGEVLQTSSPSHPERGEGHPARRRHVDSVDELQGLRLGLPGAIAIQQGLGIVVKGRRAQRLDEGGIVLVEVVVLGDEFGANVDRIDEQPAAGQVR